MDEKDEKEFLDNINQDDNKNDDLVRKKIIWDSFKRIEQPEELSIKLFPHQLVSVYNMENLERVRKIKSCNPYNRESDTIYLTDFGILGDIPGYGKSFSIVSLIVRDKMQWDITKLYERADINTVNQCFKILNKTIKQRVRANLLLCSSTLIEQWKEYFSFVKPGLLKIKEISNRKDLDKFDPNDWDVVIVSSVRYNELVNVTRNLVWKRFIFDEAASTHINSMQGVSAGFTWFISATYRAILNCSGTSSHFMRNFFNKFSGYDMLDHFVIKNPVDFVKYSFKMPQVREINHTCINPRILNVLSNYIDNETKTMIEAGDIKSAILKLGGETTTSANLFEIVEKRQKDKLISAKMSLTMWKNRKESGQEIYGGNYLNSEISFWEKRVSDIEKVITDLKTKYNSLLQDDCTICYSDIKDPILIPCCQNIFCGKCIMKWFETNKSCPMCRASINIKELIYVKKDNDTTNDTDEKEEKKQVEIKLSKQDKVLEIVSNGLAENKKFLIFSMYDESFSIIRRVFENNRINFVEISGTKSSRDSKIKKFKENKVSVVFLNSRFNGAGINLENATDIILYHEMPQSIRDQVVGRALRIGRQDDLNIHNLVYSS
jgi:SNF2 family DNA or RNA helicase